MIACVDIAAIIIISYILTQLFLDIGPYIRSFLHLYYKNYIELKYPVFIGKRVHSLPIYHLQFHSKLSHQHSQLTSCHLLVVLIKLHK